jgi:hypothetical protein
MKAEPGKHRLPYALTAIFFLRSLLILWFPPNLHDERLWLEWLGRWVLTHGTVPRALGPESLASVGAAWTPQEWLFGVILAWCAAHRFDWLPILCIALLAVVPIAIIDRRLRESGANEVTRILAITILASSTSLLLQMRATMCALAAATFVFDALHRRDTRITLIPLVVLALANIHATAIFLAGLPCIVALALFAARRTFDRDVRNLSIVGVASVAASLCTPFGLSLYYYAFNLTSGNIHSYISEWQPILLDLGNSVAAFYSLEALVLCLLIAVWHKEAPIEITDGVVLLVTGALTLYAERFAPFFLVAAIPVALRRGLRTPSNSLELLQSPALIRAFATIVIGMDFFWVGRHIVVDTSVQIAERPGLRMPAEWFDPYLDGAPADKRVFCSDFTYCNMYLFAGSSTMLDGRVDPFPENVFKNVILINRAEKGWIGKLDDLKINVVVVSRGTVKLAHAMQKLNGWHRITSDDEIITYGRDRPNLQATS